MAATGLVDIADSLKQRSAAVYRQHQQRLVESQRERMRTDAALMESQSSLVAGYDDNEPGVGDHAEDGLSLHDAHATSGVLSAMNIPSIDDVNQALEQLRTMRVENEQYLLDLEARLYGRPLTTHGAFSQGQYAAGSGTDADAVAGHAMQLAAESAPLGFLNQTRDLSPLRASARARHPASASATSQAGASSSTSATPVLQTSSSPTRDVGRSRTRSAERAPTAAAPPAPPAAVAAAAASVRERPSSPGSRSSVSSSGSFTIPEPFSFADFKHEGSQTVRNSISKRRFEEYLRELKERDDKELSFQFKANPVPKSTMQKVFSEYVARLEAKQKEWKARSKLRDAERRKAEKEKKDRALYEAEMRQRAAYRAVQFHAHPVPESSRGALPASTAHEPSPSRLGLLDEMALGDENRRKRIQHSAEAKLQESSLPPRMALAKETYGKKTEALRQKMETEDRKRREFHAHDVPDFSDRHATLPATQQESTETYIKTRRELLAKLAKPKRTESIGNVPETPLEHMPKSTKTTWLRREALLREKQLKEDAAELRRREEDAMMRKSREMTHVVASMLRRDTSQQEAELKERRTQFHQQVKQQEGAYQKLVQGMYARVRERPMLFQQVSRDAAKMRAEDKFLRVLAEHNLPLDAGTAGAGGHSV